MEKDNIIQQELFEFEEKKTIKGYPELRWTGKRPYKSTQYYPAQLKEVYGQPDKDGWFNKIFWGDNLQVMSHMLREYRGKIDLVYIDPPFDSKADYKKKIQVKTQKVTSDNSFFEEKQYGDIWTNDEYLQFMFERLTLVRELMSDKGTLYLHCDYRKVHHLKCILDSIFGVENFRNEITWRRQIARGMKVYASHFSFSADYLLIYTKSDESVWNRQVKITKLSKEEAVKKYNYDEKGFFRTSDPGSYSFESLCELHKQGRLYAPYKGEVLIDNVNRRVYSSNGGTVAVKYYREEENGYVLEENTIDNIWEDIPGMGIVSSEYIGYPTQKPEALLERIILSSSNPEDLVFDCFMGSGTTQITAMKLGRRFIGADINLTSIQMTSRRLINYIEKSNELLANSIGFEVHNVNNYELFNNPLEARELLIEVMNIQSFNKNNIFDGELDGRNVKIMPVNRIATKADLKELISNLPYSKYDKLNETSPNSVVDSITLVCMGHEPDLAAAFKQEVSAYKIDIEIVDILTDKKDLEFKREAQADVSIDNDELVIKSFYPMNLMQKLSLQKEHVENYRQLVESVMIDWDYDGDVLRPQIIDIPSKNELIKGNYQLPEKYGKIRVKITDLLSESLEIEVE